MGNSQWKTLVSNRVWPLELAAAVRHLNACGALGESGRLPLGQASLCRVRPNDSER